MTIGSRKETESTNLASFVTFLEGWIVRQEHYLDELLSAQQDCDNESRKDYFKDLIARVLTHYQQYYDAKSRAAQQDIFFVFSPNWLTSLELTFLWIAGFKPSILFEIVSNSVIDLSEEQRQSLSSLIDETRVEERNLSHKLAKFHENVAGPSFLRRMRRYGRRPLEAELSEEESVLDEFRSEIQTVLATADSLRMRTTLKVVEIMNTVQNVKFLTAATQLQVTIRNRGLQIDAKREEEEEEEE